MEEIVVLDARRVSGSGADMLLGSRTATPQSWIVARFDAHHRQPGFLLGFRVRVVARGGLRTG